MKNKRIETKSGLNELLKRYTAAGADLELIKTVEGCIKEGLAMDELDYENTPKNLKKLWAGLR